MYDYELFHWSIANCFEPRRRVCIWTEWLFFHTRHPLLHNCYSAAKPHSLQTCNKGKMFHLKHDFSLLVCIFSLCAYVCQCICSVWHPPIDAAEKRTQVGAENTRKHVVSAIGQVDGRRPVPRFQVRQAVRLHEICHVRNVHAQFHVSVFQIPGKV